MTRITQNFVQLRGITGIETHSERGGQHRRMVTLYGPSGTLRQTLSTSKQRIDWYFRDGKVYFSLHYENGLQVATTYADGNIVEQTIDHVRSGFVSQVVRKMILRAGINEITPATIAQDHK